MPLDAASPSPYLATVVAFGVILLLLVVRNRRPRPLRVELLWVRPVLLLAIFGVGAAREPISLTPLALAVLIAAAAVGVALGWQRGRFMRIEVDPDTHAVTSHASILGVVFILGVLLLRLLAVGAMRETAAQLPVPPILGSDALVVLVVAMVTTQGLEMWLRARRLLADARAARQSIAGDAPIVS
jgi:DMSO reductase anchor subunit